MSGRILGLDGKEPSVYTPRTIARDLLFASPLPKIEPLNEKAILGRCFRGGRITDLGSARVDLIANRIAVKAEPQRDEDDPWVHTERIDLSEQIKQSIEEVKMEDHDFAPTSLLDSFSRHEIETWIQSVVSRRLDESNCGWLASLRADDVVNDLKRRAERNGTDSVVGVDIANYLDRMALGPIDETLADRFRRLRLEIRDIFGIADHGAKKAKRDRRINPAPRRILPLRHAKRIRLDDGTWKRVDELN